MVQHKQPQFLALWIIWSALFGGIVIYQFALGGGVPKGENAPGEGLGIAVVLSFGQIAVASIIRWVFLPRSKGPGQLLVLMIIGLVLSEAVEIYGLFLVPANQPGTKLTLWILSLLSALQFIPLYAKSGDSAADRFRTD